ncbi:MAG TPA: hypothetical protein VLT36_05985 [Candidatus Dormibacteraeota bacterium]|nr:hypothetical protein [Candidatus Dormibacteraeota bacterium]
MNLCFAELPLGTKFEFFGRKYRKIAPSMSEIGPERTGFVFRDETPVMVETEIPGAARLLWKPDPVHWADRLSAAPGQR